MSNPKDLVAADGPSGVLRGADGLAGEAVAGVE